MTYEVKIPAGETVFFLNVKWRLGNVVYTGDNLGLKYNFKAGRVYYLTLGYENGRHGLDIEDRTTKETVFRPFFK
ncbi:MAG: hypothetical protein LBK13_05270 [Spirochaetales bacterium]|jgi:hypothetical protein|nr:hypothetical protein [Spirochaetales bacterium]